MRAAEAGKQVVALVELKARFDEQANIERARELEEAGVHVVYGLVGLKTHTKILLVVRQEHDGIRRYCHVGTGNYNPMTANLYEDLGLLTADPELGADLTELFNYLTGYSRQGEYRQLARRAGDACGPALRPHRARGREGRRRAHRAEDEQPRRPRRSSTRCTTASQRGRAASTSSCAGICCLRPGVPGPVREHPRAVDRRSLPRALADLPVRRAIPTTPSTSSARPT